MIPVINTFILPTIFTSRNLSAYRNLFRNKVGDKAGNFACNAIIAITIINCITIAALQT